MHEEPGVCSSCHRIFVPVQPCTASMHLLEMAESCQFDNEICSDGCSATNQNAQNSKKTEILKPGSESATRFPKLGWIIGPLVGQVWARNSDRPKTYGSDGEETSGCSFCPSFFHRDGFSIPKKSKHQTQTSSDLQCVMG